jgi:vancomycin permeability regulator SanA
MNGLIVVLGSPNSEEGKLYSIAKARCRMALDEYARRDDWKILLTGGYGAHFNTTDQPHAAYLKDYLTTRGIPEDDIVEFAESTNTIEDASFSKPIVQRYGVTAILVITSDYHEDRARYVFEKEFSDTGVKITFCVAQTDEAVCEFDLEAQKRHEREALERLKRLDS